MELRELIIALAGFSIGLGIGLGVYAVRTLRATRNERWLAKSGKRYDELLVKINNGEDAMKARIQELSELKEHYRVK